MVDDQIKVHEYSFLEFERGARQSHLGLLKSNFA